MKTKLINIGQRIAVTLASALVAFIIVGGLIFLNGCTAAGQRSDAKASFKDDVSIVQYEGHDYIIWVNDAYKGTGDPTFLSGITHSASCKHPDHKLVPQTPKVPTNTNTANTNK